MRNSILRKTLLLTAVIALLFGCGKKNALKGVFQKQTPYEKYANALKDAKLDNTALGLEWIKAGQEVFKDSLYLTVPFSETAYFDAAQVNANSYRFIAERGQQLNIRLEIQSEDPLAIFLDLFLLDGEPDNVASSDTASTLLEYEIEESGEYLLRVQPELLRGGKFTISVTSTPVLAFPVLGKDSRAVASFYGADRDGGIRKHEGVDIFAPRGTPVVAAVKGSVGRVNTNRLGGKVVWLRDPQRNFSLYYAHLDTQLVVAGQRVDIGDTLGLVGNTGNAITTPPHLHLGIYSFGTGAIDPYPFIHEKNSSVQTDHLGADLVSTMVRVRSTLVNFRLSPDLKSTVIVKLPKNALLHVQGATEEWLRAETPELLEGYVHANMVEPIDNPLQTISADTIKPLYNRPGANAISFADIKPNTSFQVLAELEDYYFIETEESIRGWVDKRQ